MISFLDKIYDEKRDGKLWVLSQYYFVDIFLYFCLRDRASKSMESCQTRKYS